MSVESTCDVSSPRAEESARPFPLHPCLVDAESEVAFLRCVARILLLCLLPQKDARSHTLRCCLTEVITTKGPFYSSEFGGVIKKNKKPLQQSWGFCCLTSSNHVCLMRYHLCESSNLTSRTEDGKMFPWGVCVYVCVAAVLKPLVEVLSDPDSINRMLLSQLDKREQQLEQQKKAYTYAASYEDFMKLISTSVDVNFLNQLRSRNIQWCMWLLAFERLPA